MKLVSRFGRRGVTLFLLGIPWVVYGAAIALLDMQRFTIRPDGVLQFMESRWWALLWIICGGVSILAGLFRSVSRVPYDEVGFVGLTLPPIVWGLTYFFSWMLHIFSNGEFGRVNGVFGFILFTSYSLFLMFIARWPDPDDPHVSKAEVDI